MNDSTSTFNPQTSWTRRRNLNICRLLQRNEILWNTQHPQYDNIKQREKVLLDITHELAKEIPGLELNDVRKKVHNLRSQYRKQLITDELRRRNGQKRPSQSWVLKELDFLRKNYIKKTHASKFRNNVKRDPLQYLQSSTEDSDDDTADSPKVIDVEPVEYYEPHKSIEINDDNLQFAKRFAWLGKDIDSTFKSLRSDKLKKAALLAMQKILKSARLRDSDQEQLADNKWETEFLETATSVDEAAEQDSTETNKRSCFKWNYDMSVYNADEIKITLQNGELHITACHMEHDTNGLGYVTRKFERSFELPNGYDDNIEATFSEDGVLCVTAVERPFEIFEEHEIAIQQLR